MPRKDFTDSRAKEKQRQLDSLKRKAKSAKKALKQSKRETQQALDKSALGWTTRDGKEL